MLPHIRQMRPNWSLTVAVYRVADLASILLGLIVAQRAWKPIEHPQFTIALIGAILAFTITSEISGSYRSWRGATFMGEITNVWITWTITMTTLLIVGAVTQYGSGLTRLSFCLWGAVTAVLLSMARSSIRTVLSWLRSRGVNTRGFAVVGVTDLGIQLARNIQKSPQLGLQLVGFYDDRPARRTADLPSEFGTPLGNIAELVDASRRGHVHTVYITFPMRAEERIRAVLRELSDTTASVYIVPDFFVFELLHSRWNNIQGLPVVSIFENPFFGVDGVSKRIVDLVLACALLVLAAIPMAIIGLAIKLSSAGPVFFRQKRYGLDGEEIRVWKFRSMRVCEDGEQLSQAKKEDDRVTAIGRMLRRSSLDELPQLFNVLTGEMSLVGPRPHANAHNELYRGQIRGYMLRHKVKPGITGLAQVHGWRGETDTLEKMEKRVEFDHRYIREWTLGLDLKILLRTILVVLSGHNAY